MHATLTVLSESERAQVHERTLGVLARTGMRVDTAEGRRILAAAGAEVDETTRVARFPASFVEECLRLAPRDFSLGGRREDFSYPLNDGRFTLLADGGATGVIDRETGRRRPPRHQDWADAVRLQDVLDDIGLYWCATEYPGDYEEPAGFVRYLVELFTLFGKHVQDSFGVAGLAPWALEVLDIIFGGREAVRGRHPLSFLITPTSPLTIERDFTDAWLAMRGWDIPVAIMPMPLQGATAPGSRLGTLLAANCETLGTLCLVQAAAPGTPIIYAPVIATMDPRSGRYAAGAVEHAALSVAGTEMARFYGLPAEASGLVTQHFVPCIQAAWEKTSGGLLATLSWPDVLVGPGLLAGATLLSLEQIVFDVEVVRLARQARAGVPVRDDLWLDAVMDKVGPCGSFLAERSTRDNLRDEWWMSDLGLHDTYEAWQAAGAPSSLDYARERVDELLAAHRPHTFPEDVTAALRDLEARARG